MLYAKSMREEAGRIAVQMQTLLDANPKGFKDNNDDRVKWDALADSHTKLEHDITRAEKADDLMASLRLSMAAHNPLLNGNVGDDENPASTKDQLLNLTKLRDTFRMSAAQKKERDADPICRAFSAYLRYGLDEMQSSERDFLNANMRADLTSPIRNVTSTTTGSQGGYLIPQGFSNALEEAMKWFGGIEGTVEVFTTGTGNAMPWPTNNDTGNRGRIIGQNVPVSQVDPNFSNVTFNAYIGSSDIVLIPLALIQDSYFDIDTFTARLLGVRLGRLYNWKGTVGTGTNEPTGIVVAATTAGNVTTFPGGQTVSLTYNNFVDIEHSVDPAYRYNPATRWMFHDTVLKTLKKLVDGQSRPLWQPGLSASFQNGAGVVANKPMILDHPYSINNDMAVPASDAYSIVFGDLSKFKVREVAGGTTVMRLVERFADFLQIGYTAFRRFDSNLVDAGTHPIALGRQSTS